MTKQTNVRELIVEVLLEITRDGEYSHLALRNVLEKYQYLEKQDRAFLTRVTEGTLERMIELDYIINSFSKVPVNKTKPVIRCILRSAVYQLKYMDRIPNSAVCNEAVKLALKKGFSNLRGFVNGVLRNIARGLDSIEYPSENDQPVEYLSVVYSTPVWMVEELLQAYGYSVTKTILNAFLEGSKETIIRCNLERISMEELIKLLEAEGVRVEPSPLLSYAAGISGYNYLQSLETFQKGYFQVQDYSSMLAAEAAGVQEGNRILDICAAPGGKSLHMAELLRGTGEVEARDLTAYKIGLIEENIKRHHVKQIKAVQADATVFDAELVDSFDIVMADLPCSGLGVIEKKTDIKYKASKEKILELAALQRTILKQAASYVKPGGTLIYSTCTITPQENKENREWFLSQFDYLPDSLDDYLPKELHSNETKEGYLQLLPGIHGCDGFYIARFKRKI